MLVRIAGTCMGGGTDSRLATTKSRLKTATERVRVVSGRDASLPVHYVGTSLAPLKAQANCQYPECQLGKSGRRELSLLATTLLTPRTCSVAVFQPCTCSVAVTVRLQSLNRCK